MDCKGQKDCKILSSSQITCTKRGVGGGREGEREIETDRERGGQGDRERGSRIQFTSGTNNIKLKLNKVIEYLSVQ